jgi:hypothetical protein
MVSIFKKFLLNLEKINQKKIINEPKSKCPIWQYNSNLELVFNDFNRHWLYFCLVWCRLLHQSSRLVAWSGREKLWSFFALKKLPHNQDKKMCICKLAMAERFDERLN